MRTLSLLPLPVTLDPFIGITLLPAFVPGPRMKAPGPLFYES